MTENYMKPEDVDPQDAQKVLDFLNAAKSSTEIADAVEILNERDVGEMVASHILRRRQELGGFTNLQQVADVQQVGPERFTEIIVTLRQRGVGGDVMAEVIEIGYYWLNLYASREESHHLYLAPKPGQSYSKILRVHFVEDSQVLPGKVTKTTDGFYDMYYRRSAFPDIVDMLRNEKPIFFRWLSDTEALLSTNMEAVGEEETQ